LGTFGLWSAYLRQNGHVILVNETSPTPTYIEPFIREHLPNWMFIQDPCYHKDSMGNLQLKEDCIGLD